VAPVSAAGAARAVTVALTVAIAIPRVAAGQPSSDAGWVADGGAPNSGPFADPIYAQCPPSDPAQPATQRDDGAWVLPPLRAARQVCLLTTCDERRKQLEGGAPVLSTAAIVVSAIALAIGLGLGGYLGWAVARWLPR
jgi:hypothetical protein